MVVRERESLCGGARERGGERVDARETERETFAGKKKQKIVA